MEDSALDALVRRLDLAEVRDRLSGASALCLRHFLAALGQADDAAARRLVDAQLAAIAEVGRHLDEFIRKHDYRFSAEGITAGEARAWRRAVELLVGSDPLELREGWSPPR